VFFIFIHLSQSLEYDTVKTKKVNTNSKRKRMGEKEGERREGDMKEGGQKEARRRERGYCIALNLRIFDTPNSILEQASLKSSPDKGSTRTCQRTPSALSNPHSQALLRCL
jgi:hypothetical protein